MWSILSKILATVLCFFFPCRSSPTRGKKNRRNEKIRTINLPFNRCLLTKTTRGNLFTSPIIMIINFRVEYLPTTTSAVWPPTLMKNLLNGPSSSSNNTFSKYYFVLIFIRLNNICFSFMRREETTGARLFGRARELRCLLVFKSRLNYL